MTTIIPPSDYSPEIVKISLRGRFVSLMPGGVCVCVSRVLVHVERSRWVISRRERGC